MKEQIPIQSGLVSEADSIGKWLKDRNRAKRERTIGSVAARQSKPRPKILPAVVRAARVAGSLVPNALLDHTALARKEGLSERDAARYERRRGYTVQETHEFGNGSTQVINRRIASGYVKRRKMARVCLAVGAGVAIAVIGFDRYLHSDWQDNGLGSEPQEVGAESNTDTLHSAAELVVGTQVTILKPSEIVSE